MSTLIPSTLQHPLDACIPGCWQLTGACAVQASQGRATSGKRARSAPPAQEFSFVQCCRCKQWRRVPAQNAHPEGWDCRTNPDPR